MGSNLDSLFASVHAAFNREKYYSQKDVEVINAARKLFCECFPNRSLPRELRYEHEPKEEEGVNLESTPEVPTNNHYQPPYILFDEKKEYSVTQVDSKLGKNELRTVCENSIKDIHGYLNAVNIQAARLLNKLPGTNHGIFSDASRFICLLIRNAFMVFSALDLRDRNVSIEAEAYINFLQRLVHDPVICRVFADRTMVEGYGNPLAVINAARKNLVVIDSLIKHYRSRFGVLEYAGALKSNVINFIDVGVLFSVYILSNIKINETDTKIERRSFPHLTDKTPTLEIFRIAFSNALTLESTNKRLIEDRKNTELAKFTYDTRLKTWLWDSEHTLNKEQSGIYAPFLSNTELMPDFYKFCSFLKLLSDTKKELVGLENILRAGGNIFAAFYFSKKIEITLVTLEHLLREMNHSYERIMVVAEKEHDRLVSLGQSITDEEKTWLKNYRDLKNLLYRKGSITKLKEDLLENVCEVRQVLESWRENPENKIEEFKEEVATFVRDQQITTSTLAVTSSKYAELIKELESHESRVALLPESFSPDTNSLRAAINAETPLLLTPGSSVLQLVKSKLIEYAKKTGYAFKIPEVDPSIGLPDNAPQPWGFTSEVRAPELHADRIQWMFSFFSALFAEADEKRKLEGLKDRIAFKKVQPFFQPLHANDDFLEMMGQIEGNIQARLNDLKINEASSKGGNMQRRQNPVQRNQEFQAVSMIRAGRRTTPGEVEVIEESDGAAPPAFASKFPTQPASTSMVVRRNTVSPLYGHRQLANVRPAQEILDTSKVSFVSHLQNMINRFSKKPADDIQRIQFLAFWKELCCLNESMKRYHTEHLHERKKLTRSIQYLEGIQRRLSGPAAQQLLGIVALRLLETKKEAKQDEELSLVVRHSASNLVSAKERLEDKAQQAVRHLKTIEDRLYRYQMENMDMEGYRLYLFRPGMDISKIKNGEMYIEFRGMAITYHVLAPNEEIVTADIELADFIIEAEVITKLQHAFQLTDLEPYLVSILKITTARNHTQSHAHVWNTPRREELQVGLGQLGSFSSESVLEILAQVSACLLQLERANAVTDNVALDAVLMSALSAHSKSEIGTADNFFWANIIRGLLALGANPLTWMNAQTRNDKNISNERTYYLMAEQAGLILSHLEFRAKHLGESAVFLRDKLDALLEQVKLFAERLYACVDSEDKTQFINWILRMPYNRARPERAALFWATLNWIYVFLNEDQLIDPQTKTSLQVLKGAEAFFQNATKMYEEKIGSGSWFVNDGSKSWASLCAAVKDVNEAMITLGALRGTQAVSEKNAALEGQLNLANQEVVKVQSCFENAIRKLLIKRMDTPAFLQLSTPQAFIEKVDEILNEVEEIFTNESKAVIHSFLCSILTSNMCFKHFVDFIPLISSSSTQPAFIPPEQPLPGTSNPLFGVPAPCAAAAVGTLQF
jgi:hypothetical protein